jgi:hypothetical protein
MGYIFVCRDLPIPNPPRCTMFIFLVVVELFFAKAGIADSKIT